MGVDLAKVLQDFSSAVDFIRKTNEQIYDVYVNPAPKDVTIYGPDGQVISSVPNRAKLVAEFEDWKANVRREYPAFNILQNPWFIDTDGDGKLNSPLSVWVTGDHSVEENTVYAYNDDSLPDIVKQALLDIKAARYDAGGNLTNCCIVPFNVQKVAVKGTYDGGRGALLPGNAVKGIVSAGALAVISTTGNIKIEGLGELEKNQIYKYVVFRNGVYVDWNIDVPGFNANGTADLWIIGPWVVPGRIADSPGENKSAPLFVHPNGAYIK